MKEKLLRTKKELEKEYNLNSKEIRKLKEKIKVLELNTIEGKVDVFTKSFAVSFPIIMILSVIIGISFPTVISSIIGTNPLYILRDLFLGSIISGFIVERIISKVNHKKINKFSGAKTEYQKREEMFGYELEKQKLNDKNNAINKAYGFVSDLETKVDVCNLDFGNSNMSKEEQENNNKKLRENINNKERELEILSTQLFLNRNFIMQRTRLGKLGTIGTPFAIGLLTSMVAVVGSMVFTPTIFMESVAAAESILRNTALIGGSLGVVASSLPTYLRNKQNRRIFNKFNDRLGENKLPENIDSDIKERRKIVTKGNKIIEELATAHLTYQDSTRELERIQKEEFITKSVESGYKKEKIEEVCQIIEELVENHQGSYNRNDGESVFDAVLRGLNNLDGDLDLETEVEVRKEIEGPTLVKRK